MKRILLLGALDKTDLIFYMAKLMSKHKKVLVADVTEHHRYEYAYPKVQAEDAPIQQHDEFDVAENIQNYLHLEKVMQSTEYDIILIDADHLEALQYWPVCDEYILVTSYENPVIQRNAKVLESYFREKPMAELLSFHKIIYEAGSTLTEKTINESLDRLPIVWDETFVYYPDERDMQQKIRNQYSNTVSIKGLSRPYRQVLSEIVGRITDTRPAVMKTIWKQTERSR